MNYWSGLLIYVIYFPITNKPFFKKNEIKIIWGEAVLSMAQMSRVPRSHSCQLLHKHKSRRTGPDRESILSREWKTCSEGYNYDHMITGHCNHYKCELTDKHLDCDPITKGIVCQPELWGLVISTIHHHHSNFKLQLNKWAISED